MEPILDAAGFDLSEEGLRNYLEVANTVRNIGLENRSQLIERCARADSLIGQAISSACDNATVAASLLNLNSRLLYCAAIQTALTGHVAAIYPTLRACLESACYAESIVHNPELGQVWIERHKDEDAKKRCRKSFGVNLVRDAGSRLEAILEGADSLIIDTYERHIDHGAHPNPAGVVLGMQISETPENLIFNVAGPTSEMVERSLLECFETGVFVALVIANEAGIVLRLRKELMALLDIRNQWHAVF